MDYSEPVHKLYASFGFVKCQSFANYLADPNSLFMTKEI
jgi:putative acetyltransferase